MLSSWGRAGNSWVPGLMKFMCGMGMTDSANKDMWQCREPMRAVKKNKVRSKVRWGWEYLFSSFCWSITCTQKNKQVKFYSWLNVNMLNTKMLQAVRAKIRRPYLRSLCRYPSRAQPWMVRESSPGESGIRTEIQIKEGKKLTIWVLKERVFWTEKTASAEEK